jgi:hypothetical protein
VERYYRLNPADSDPEDLLDPENQVSEPWGGTVYGRCDKCGGSGTTEHRCRSCEAGGADPDCPVCQGSVTYEDECPACEGEGRIDDSKREGVSVFPTLEGLWRYMRERDGAVERSVLVELEGEESVDEDFDADEGALLVFPKRIVDAREVDLGELERLAGEDSAG